MEDKVEQEEQFILRLPIKTARKIRKILNTKPKKIKKLLQIEVNLADNSGKVRFGRTTLNGVLKNLPTVVESYKTYDKVKMFKTADVSHMLICGDEAEKQSKSLDLNHGLTPPLKNARKRRFRKTLFNQDQAIEVENIEKELWYLLRTDMEASSTTFEISFEDDSSNQEIVLFGSLSSESDEIDADICES